MLIVQSEKKRSCLRGKTTERDADGGSQGETRGELVKGVSSEDPYGGRESCPIDLLYALREPPIVFGGPCLPPAETSRNTVIPASLVSKTIDFRALELKDPQESDWERGGAKELYGEP